ncbi:FAD-dependent monooxygenase [Actinosynnema sp. NPDC020468]|uniref:FAD-dependent monooxygenase n=1 Tax=Actinosynnema sp. NPDC020468 TaxID=3154488 RepID=UPI00340122E6
MTATDPVAVVGAGPAGLTAALALRALDIPTVVYEAEPADRVRSGSRALFVHGESLALLDRLRPGLRREFAERGLVWTRQQTFYRCRQVHSRTYPPGPPDRPPPFVSLRQTETERLLLAACHDVGVRFEWDTRIGGVDVGTTGVVLSTVDGRDLPAGHVVAADGARSRLRAALGIGSPGHRSDSYHVVVDVEEDPADPRPPARVFHYEHPGLGGRNVLVVPFASGFQVDLQCRATDADDEFATLDAVRRWLPRVVPAAYAERIRWASKYHFTHRVADTFTDPRRRVLLVGEAAHLFPPFGARGMNSGIADADSAATAIAVARLATSGARARAAVDEFAERRRAAALANSAAAAAALAHMRPRGRVRVAARRVSGLLAPWVPSLGAWLDRAPYGPGRAVAPATGRY